MFKSLIVPLDGSEESARALRPASAVARYLDVTMRVLAYHSPSDDGSDLARLIHHQVAEAGDFRRVVTVEPMNQPVVELLQQTLTEYDDPLIVMSTRGGGRSAGLVGSVANSVLGSTHVPVMLVGPACDCTRIRLHGPMVVPTDSGDGTTSALALAAEMANSFDYTPVLANVIDLATAKEVNEMRRGVAGQDVAFESALVHRFATHLGGDLGVSDIDYRVLHDNHPGKAIAALATDLDASLVAMATAARTGVRRIALGSVTADVVASVTCPVIAIAPE